MATTSGIRIREPAEASGVILGLRAAERKYARYGVSFSLVSKWVKQGVVKAEQANGVMVIDERSLRAYIQHEYRPKADNQARRVRSRPLPAPHQLPELDQPRPPSANGHQAVQAPAGRGPAGPALSRPVLPRPMSARTAAPSASGGPVLDTREYIKLYYADQTRRHGQEDRTGKKELRAETEDSYDWVFDRFAGVFPAVPMDRKVILDYIHGLRNRRNGQPMSGGSKMLVHRQLSAFYNWMERERGIPRPNLTKHGIVSKRENALPLRVAEIRAVRRQVNNPSEFAIILLLAQAAVRVGELCTIRAELIHDHWVEVFGKPTKANPSGWRQVPLPDEAYDRLLKEIKFHGQLCWVNSYGLACPLAGPVEQVSRRAIDLQEGASATRVHPPQTYRVRPVKGATQRIQDLLRRRLQEAGVYEQGKNAHSFRRSYQAEFLHNGGNRDYYREIMGHFTKSSMDDLYNHIPISEVVEQARRFAPRRFLGEEVVQGELTLDQENLALQSQADGDDDDDE